MSDNFFSAEYVSSLFHEGNDTGTGQLGEAGVPPDNDGTGESAGAAANHLDNDTGGSAGAAIDVLDNDVTRGSAGTTVNLLDNSDGTQGSAGVAVELLDNAGTGGSAGAEVGDLENDGTGADVNGSRMSARLLANGMDKLQSVGLSQEEAQKIMSDEKLSILALSDPKSVKRIWKGRERAARSKQRKVENVKKLENEIRGLNSELEILRENQQTDRQLIREQSFIIHQINHNFQYQQNVIIPRLLERINQKDVIINALIEEANRLPNRQVEPVQQPAPIGAEPAGVLPNPAVGVFHPGVVVDDGLVPNPAPDVPSGLPDMARPVHDEGQAEFPEAGVPDVPGGGHEAPGDDFFTF